MRHFLVIRLSSMGDVALTIPVLQALLYQFPEVRITVLTRGFFAPMFKHLERVDVFSPDLNKEHKGLPGLYRLFKALRQQYNFDAIIDLHDVLRSNILANLFKAIAKPAYKIDKNRSQKKQYTRLNHPIIKQLKHTTQLYANVFKEVLPSFEFDSLSYQPPNYAITPTVRTFFHSFENPMLPLIGVAPFAAFDPKMYDLSQMQEVVHQLAHHNNVIIFGGRGELPLVEQHFDNIENVYSIIGKFNLTEELAIMQQLQLMLAMDSSNGHLARLAGTKVVTIWGATHPHLGFHAFGQDPNSPQLNIQIPAEELPCRPCSVYGKTPCHRKDKACMTRIAPEKIIEAVLSET